MKFELTQINVRDARVGDGSGQASLVCLSDCLHGDNYQARASENDPILLPFRNEQHEVLRFGKEYFMLITK